ncbi:MAG: putative deoxyribonuclease yabD [Chlamydiota bacterium]|jgi:TatD DNase family protein
MNFFDSHAHLSDASMLPIVDGVIARAKLAGVIRIANICTDPASLAAGLALAKKHSMIINTGATTPHDVEREGEAAFADFAEAAKSKRLHAIGETGLDYHYEHSSKTMQQAFLVRYLHLAAEVNLPVVFHCRDAFSDLFAIADSEYPKKGAAILHCFTGSMHEAEQCIKRGWLISFSGIVTFPKSVALQEVAAQIPLDHVIIETDAPYLAPQSKRGKPNEPAYLPETALCIANLKKLDVAAVAAATYDNATRFFRCQPQAAHHPTQMD